MVTQGLYEVYSPRYKIPISPIFSLPRPTALRCPPLLWRHSHPWLPSLNYRVKAPPSLGPHIWRPARPTGSSSAALLQPVPDTTLGQALTSGTCKSSHWLILSFQFWLLPAFAGCLRSLSPQQDRAPLSRTYSLNINFPSGGSLWATPTPWNSHAVPSDWLTPIYASGSFINVLCSGKSLQISLDYHSSLDLHVPWTCPTTN